MKKEIEVLWRLKTPLRKALAALARCEAAGVKRTTDDYYFDPKRPELKPSGGRLTACFRLRRQDGRAALTYKRDHFRNGVWSHSDEAETGVASAGAAAQIIRLLGLRPLVRATMVKHCFRTPRYDIFLESVRGLGSFLEVESRRPPSSGGVAAEKARIRDFVRSLGLAVGEEVNAGKPELLIRSRQRG